MRTFLTGFTRVLQRAFHGKLTIDKTAECLFSLQATFLPPPFSAKNLPQAHFHDNPLLSRPAHLARARQGRRLNLAKARPASERRLNREILETLHHPYRGQHVRPPTTPSMQTETQRERARVAATNLCASTKVSGMYRPPKSPKYPPDTSFPSYASPCSPVCLKDISDAVMPALRPSVNFLRFAAISEAGASAATYGAANQLFNSGGGGGGSSSSSSTRHKIVSA